MVTRIPKHAHWPLYVWRGERALRELDTVVDPAETKGTRIPLEEFLAWGRGVAKAKPEERENRIRGGLSYFAESYGPLPF